MSLYDLAHVAMVFDCSAYSTILFCSIYCQYKMTQYNTLNVKLSNQQLNKLKSGIKNGTELTLKSSNIVGDSNDENNFLHKF